MRSPILNHVLQLGPTRRFLSHSGRFRLSRSLRERLSRPAGVYRTLDEANEAIRRHRPTTRGHLESDLIESNYHLSGNIRISDYPVLFWLRDIAAGEPLRVFDFGGGIGQTFVNYSKRLPPEHLSKWTVHDLPEVVLHADQAGLNASRKLHLTSRLEDGADSNVFLAAGALHYWEKPIPDLFKELGTRPTHVIVNRSPMTTNSPPFYTVQQGAGWAVACLVRNLDETNSQMRSMGYDLVDAWTDPQKNLAFPWLPEFTCAYHGACFRRTGQSG